MESNFILRKIDLSNNHFTNEALTEFCHALSTNDSCEEINLTNQHSKIFESSYESVFDGLEMNETVKVFQVDFQSDEGTSRLDAILKRNREKDRRVENIDKKVLSFLRREAELAEYFWYRHLVEEEMVQIQDSDWSYLYELSVLYDKFKKFDDMDPEERVEEIPERAKSLVPEGEGKITIPEQLLSLSLKRSIENTFDLNPDGSFLTEEFITKFLKEDQERDMLTFDFCGQAKLFKTFSLTDPARSTIVCKFVDAILSHPRMSDCE
jgi:hypothetical protein